MFPNRGGDNDKLKLPSNLMKRWINDKHCSKEFKEWLDKFCEKYSVVEDEPATPEPTPKEGAEPKRKKEKETDPNSSPLKKAKIDISFIVDSGAVKAPLLFEAQVDPKQQVFVQIRAGNIACLVNKGDKDFNMNACSHLLGFGQGSFKLTKGDNEVPKEQYQFIVTSEAELVSLDGVVQTVGKCVFDERKTKPKAAVAYHSLTLNTDDPTKFQLATTHKIGFICTGETTTVNIGNIGGKLDWGLWAASKIVKVYWSVRWAKQGLLQPARPAVMIAGGLSLASGKTLFLVGTPGSPEQK